MDELIEGKRVSLSEMRLERLEIIESENGGPTKVRCIAQEADVPNQNNRLYKRAILERELAKLTEELTRHPGLANHPEGNPRVEDVSVLWTSFTWDGNLVVAEGNLVPTRVGEDIAKIGKAGVEIGVSSRGYGSVSRETIDGKTVQVVGDDFELETFDFVLSPSVRSAYVLAMENLEKDRLETLTVESLRELRPDLIDQIATEVRTQLEIKVMENEENKAEEAVVEAATEEPTEVVEEAPKEVEEVAEEQTEVVESEPASEEVTEVTESVVLDEARAKVEELTNRLAEVESEKQALAEDAANMQAIIDLCAKEIGERAKKKDFSGAGMMSSIGDMMSYMHDKEKQGSMEALGTAVDAAFESLTVQNLHTEEDKPKTEAVTKGVVTDVEAKPVEKPKSVTQAISFIEKYRNGEPLL